MTSPPVSFVRKELYVSVEFQADYWTRNYPNARSKLGETAFIEYATDETKSTREWITSQMQHVVSLPFSKLKGSEFAVDKSAIQGPNRHVYFVQEIPRQKAFRMLGGISGDRLLRISNKTTKTSFIVYLNELEMSSFYPETTAKSLHVLLHLCKPPLNEISECLAVPEMAEEVLCLVKDRISFLKTVKEVAYTQKTHSGSNEQREHDLEKLLNDPLMRASSLSTTNENTLNCCRLDDSFWYACCLCFNNHPSSATWVIDREMELLQLRLTLLCKSENDVLEIARLNNLDTLVPVDSVSLVEAGERLFHRDSPTDPLPTAWFSIPFAASAQCMKDMNCIVNDGKCIISYVHLRDCAFLDLARGHLRSLIFDNAEIRTFAHGLSDEIKEELNECIEAVVQINGFGPPVDLPDIEDCLKVFPLCTSVYANNLKKNGKLRWDQRRAFSGFLRDCGYDKEETASYLCSVNKTKNNGILDPEWGKEVESLVNRRPKEDAPAAKGSFAKGCTALITKMTNVAHESNAAECCPYKFFERDKLIEALTLKGLSIQDPWTETIVNIANQNPVVACMKMFEFEHGKQAICSKKGYWTPNSPQGYTRRALRQKKLTP